MIWCVIIISEFEKSKNYATDFNFYGDSVLFDNLFTLHRRAF
jgi:hypothetical protein